MNFIIIIASLILVLTIINMLSQYQSKKRIRHSASETHPTTKGQTRILTLQPAEKVKPQIAEVEELN